MKHLFIINPAAGSKDRTKDYSVAIHEICSARNLDYHIEVSAAPGDVMRIAREAAQSGEEVRIYACGGDGTLNEAAAGAAGYPNAAVTVFSGGSGNDFVKLFNDPKAFFDLERLLDAEEAEFDMIRCNGDLALNICSVGLDARIAADVASYKRLPLLQGFHPVPEADPADGWLDVLLVKKVSLMEVPAAIGKYKDGRYKELPHLVRHLRTKEMKVRCDKASPVNLDGELRMAEVVDFRLADEKLRFFYPKGLVWRMKETVCSK